ncbi:GTP cyclohydrolase II [Lichenibacterium dinghuense]|uniref:GTP cyclohydrolase II n=1 Tax=Lichenibacterium dinghuense TaxID=2895977 RepID=UPI001F02D33D|nr:GTP cyclohydrolase II [Lichenibacterium sp. 6Y81]
MVRWDEAMAGLRAGGSVVLVDEAREGAAHVVAPTPLDLDVVTREGHGPLTAALDPRATLDAGPGRIEFLQVAPRIGGVLLFPEPVEAAHDLVAAAGAPGPAVLRAAALRGGVLAAAGAPAAFAERLGLPLVSIQDVVAHRLARETIVERVASAQLPSLYSDEPLEVHAFRGLLDGTEHLALVRRPGGPASGAPLGPEPLVRLHSECLTGDALGSLRCDCGDQLRRALKQIGDDPQGGAVVYLRGQEGRGIGLANKIRAYALQERGLDTVEANAELGFPADMRDYGTAVQILRELGIARLRLLSNNPRKRAALERYGVVVAERRSLRIGPNPHNATYLETKRVKLGHDLARLKVVSEQ